MSQQKPFFSACTSISIAIFSMFFGAGNVIYPILLAAKTAANYKMAFVGLFLTAIGGPFLGLFAGALCKGSAKEFFFSAGKIPGMILLSASLALLGPLAVLPRCISVSYAAITAFVPSLSLQLFTTLFCVLCFVCTFKRQSLLSILSWVLSPILLGCLALIIFKGIRYPTNTLPVQAPLPFVTGMTMGYDTMDLIASIIFSSGIWSLVSAFYPRDLHKTFKATLVSSALACSLLAVIYFGLSLSAAKLSNILIHTPKQQMMSVLATSLLGPKMALVANLIVSLACLTTVMGLVMTLSEIISKGIKSKKVTYFRCVFFLIFLSGLMTSLGFEKISALIHLFAKICYPLIILLTLWNIFVKGKEVISHIRAKRSSQREPFEETYQKAEAS